MSALCNFCNDPCTLICAHCKKVSYCSKNHQKFDRKTHRPACFPGILTRNPVLGNHLVATRDISPGEKILEDRPLVVGPRGNAGLSQICLGCCHLVAKDPFECPICQWKMCREECHQNPWHKDLECGILAGNKVEQGTTPEDCFYITILRCVILNQKNPGIWAGFESHQDPRHRHKQSSKRCWSAANFIRNKVRIPVENEEVERIYGILTINGYSDESKYYIKIYEYESKISHSCLPNTRSQPKSLSKNSPLQVTSTLKIPLGQPLTQLYGSLLTGTHRRQDLLQNVYQFQCSCERCLDTTELGTQFSGIWCRSKSCRRIVLPVNPLNLNSPWRCDSCKKKWTYDTLVFPALGQVAKLTQMTVDDPLWSQFEVYTPTGEVLVGPEAILEKIAYARKMSEAIALIEKETVHPNHYALIPVKTALISTIYRLLAKDRVEDEVLAKVFVTLTSSMVTLLDVLSPGMTRNRGIALFFLATSMEIQGSFKKDGCHDNSFQERWEEAEGILKLEPASDDFNQLLQNRRK